MTFIGVGEWLARRTELTPNKIALVDFETQTRLTYRDLNQRTRALATTLQEQYTIKPGDGVAALAMNSPEYLDAFFAVALLGAILVPLNWRLTARELGVILADCEPKLLPLRRLSRRAATQRDGQGGQDGTARPLRGAGPYERHRVRQSPPEYVYNT
jgi:acyl-CoA synthetase (AMP-forming)/AMP-acid ligase II